MSGFGKRGPKGRAGAAGTNGSNGTNGADGNTIIYGTGAPSNGTGNNGDSYIATDTHYIYGPKAAGVWPAGTSIVGPQGPAGSNGSNGTNGATGATGPSSFGTLTAQLSGNVTFSASQALTTVLTITPADNRFHSIWIFVRGVSTTNDGTNLGADQIHYWPCRKASGTVVMGSRAILINQRNSPLGSMDSSLVASGGNILCQASTSGGAMVLTKFDVYIDSST